ncbi:MAG: ribosome maturation factor RimM [Fulvivirga sp.]|nr:ribosome maturation factor RimM [Fulvivirga sp.]
MTVDECYQLGYVIKKHGLNGEVTVFLDVDFPEAYETLESVFVEINQKLVPFFIDQIQIRGKKANIRFEDISSADQADELRGKGLYLPLDQLPQLDENQFYYHEIMGYQLHDQPSGVTGNIISVLTGPQQDLLVVDVQGKEVLVPINDELILRVDHKNKALQVALPEGLLDIYLK